MKTAPHLNTEEEVHQCERNESPRLQTPFDTNKRANVAAPDGVNKCITASAPNFTSNEMFPKWTIKALPRHASSELMTTVGRAWRVEFFYGWEDTCQMIHCINHSARGGEKTLYSPFFLMMTSICCIHLPSLLTQAGPKRKPRFQVLVLSISTIPFSQNGGGGRRRWNRLSVYSRLFHLDGLPQRSRLGSSYSEHISGWLWRSGMLSPLRWQIQAAMWREREKVWRPIHRGAAIIKKCFLWFWKMDTHCPSPLYQGCTFQQALFILHRLQWEQMVR